MRRLLLLTTLILTTATCPAHAQQPFPARGVEIVNGLYAGVNPQDDTARRERIKITCEQMRFELGARWGGKRRAGNGTPVSPDSLAYLEPDSSVSIWDIQTSTGAITVFENKPPDYPNDSPANSTFIVCEPVDHLGSVVVPPDPPAPVPPADLGPIEKRLQDMEGVLGAILIDQRETRKSLEEHRLEARKTRSAVMGFLSDWRNYVKIASGVIGAIGVQQMTSGQ